MKISHVIRGDDHMINSFKQKQIYDATYQVFLLARKNLVKGITLKDFQSTVVEEMDKQLISRPLRPLG